MVDKFCIDKNLAFSFDGTVPKNNSHAVLLMVVVVIVVFLPWESLTNIIPDAWRHFRMANENVFGNDKNAGNVTRYFFWTLYDIVLLQFTYVILPIYFLFQHVCRGYFGFGIIESMVISSFILTFVRQTNLSTFYRKDPTHDTTQQSLTIISVNPLLFTIFFIQNIILLSIFQRAGTLWIPMLGLTASVLVNTILFTAMVFK